MRGLVVVVFFFFKQKTAYEMSIGDWSSDVCSSDLYVAQAALMGPARPVLIDQFLEEATEVDVDALADGTDVIIGGIMEHIEEAGVHSGDSSCVLPPVSLTPAEARKR